MTYGDIITLAVGLIGGLTQGEGNNASEISDSFLRLLLLIDGWNADPDNQFGTVTTQISLAPTQASYAIGPGGDFNIARPTLLKGVRVVVAGISRDLSPINKAQYNAIDEPLQPGIFPKKFYDDGGFPSRTMKIHPVASLSGTIEIDAPFLLPVPVATTDNVVLPQGFARGLVYNLAIELAAAYDLQLNSPEIAIIAISSKRDMQKAAIITAQGGPSPAPELPGLGRGEPSPPQMPAMPQQQVVR